MNHRSMLPACVLALAATAASAEDSKVIPFENDAGIVVTMEGAGRQRSRSGVDAITHGSVLALRAGDAPQMESTTGMPAAVFRRLRARR
jgi:hypothetical protein